MPLMFKPRAPVYDPKAGPVVFVVLLRGVQSNFMKTLDGQPFHQKQKQCDQQYKS
jgi:hypothetical protein